VRTRRTYPAVHRTFGAFLGPDATAEVVMPAAVRASAIRTVRSATVARGEPRALSPHCQRLNASRH